MEQAETLKQGELFRFGDWRRKTQEQISVEEKRLKQLLRASVPKPLGEMLQNDRVIVDIVQYLYAHRKYYPGDEAQSDFFRSVVEFRNALNNLRRAWRGVVKISCVKEGDSGRFLVTFTAIAPKKIRGNK